MIFHKIGFSLNVMIFRNMFLGLMILMYFHIDIIIRVIVSSIIKTIKLLIIWPAFDYHEFNGKLPFSPGN